MPEDGYAPDCPEFVNTNKAEGHTQHKDNNRAKYRTGARTSRRSSSRLISLDGSQQDYTSTWLTCSHRSRLMDSNTRSRRRVKVRSVPKLFAIRGGGGGRGGFGYVGGKGGLNISGKLRKRKQKRHEKQRLHPPHTHTHTQTHNMQYLTW